MIAHTTWRDLFYKLAEAHPDCLMLNFTVKVIHWSAICKNILNRFIVLASNVGCSVTCNSSVFLLMLLIKMWKKLPYKLWMSFSNLMFCFWRFFCSAWSLEILHHLFSKQRFYIYWVVNLLSGKPLLWFNSETLVCCLREKQQGCLFPLLNFLAFVP